MIRPPDPPTTFEEAMAEALFEVVWGEDFEDVDEGVRELWLNNVERLHDLCRRRSYDFIGTRLG